MRGSPRWEPKPPFDPDPFCFPKVRKLFAGFGNCFQNQETVVLDVLDVQDVLDALDVLDVWDVLDVGDVRTPRMSKTTRMSGMCRKF